MEKFSQYTTGQYTTSQYTTLYKINDIILPVSNNTWVVDDIENRCLLDINNTIIDFDKLNYVITSDSMVGKSSSGYEILTTPIIAKIHGIVLPISLVKSIDTGTIYIFDMRHVIKINHEYGKPNKSHYMLTDNSMATITKAFSTYAKTIGVGNYIQILRPLLYDNVEYQATIEEDMNYEDNNTIFTLISYPYTKMVDICGETRFWKFVNIYSPITKNKYSVLYDKRNERV